MPTIPMPQYPSAQSRPIGTPYQNIDASTGGRELSQGLQQLGAGVVDVGKAYDVHRARALQIRKQEELTKFNHGITSELYGAPEAMKTGEAVSGGWGLDVSTDEETVAVPNGYLNLQGKAPLAAEKQVLDALRKRQQEIADGIEDEQLRAEFLSDSNVLYEDTRRRMAIHASQQVTVAEQASQKAMVEQGLTSIAAAYDDEETVQTQFSIMADALRKSALSEEDGNGKVAALQATIAKTRVQKYLAAQDYEGAQRVLDASNRVLSHEDSVQLAKDVSSSRLNGAAEGIAERLSHHEQVADRYGRIDLDKALEVVDQHIPASETKLRDEVKQRLVQRATAAERRYSEDTKEISGKAFAAYNDGGWGGIPPKLKDELNERNPELYHRLKEDSIQRWRRAKSDSAESRREQTERNRIAYNDFMALPPEVRATLDIGQFLAGRGVDDVGKSALGPAQQNAKEFVQKGQATGENEFVQNARANAVGMLDKDSVKEFDAAARIAYSDKVRELGRPPSREESAELINQLTRTEIEKKSLFGIDALWPDEETPGYRRIADQAKSRRGEVSTGEGTASQPAAPAQPPAQRTGAPPQAAVPPAGPPPSIARPGVVPGDSKSSLPPGRYTDRSGRVVVVDAQGNKRFE